MIDRSLIDELLDRRLDPVHVLHGSASSGDLHGIEPGSLRRVRENIGVASDPPLAARAGFQLGIELPDPTESLEELEREAERWGTAGSGGEAHSSNPLDYRIAVFMARLFVGERVTTRIDKVWCEQHGVTMEAVERVCDTCGRFLNPEAASGSAFELAIEARVAVSAWATPS